MILTFRLPLIEGRPIPKTLLVRAGDYRTGPNGAVKWVSVPEQTGRVAGWHYSYPDRQIVLRVEVASDAPQA